MENAPGRPLAKSASKPHAHQVNTLQRHVRGSHAAVEGLRLASDFPREQLHTPAFGAAETGCADAPLGTNAKSASPQHPISVPLAHGSCGFQGYEKGSKTSNEGRFLGNNTKSSPPPLRKIRYALQDAIRKLVLSRSDFDPDNPDFEVYNKLPRVVKCKRTRVKDTVDIYHSPSEGKAHYQNLHTCASVWSCPVCAERIQEQRRQEIHQAIEWAQSEGLMPVMVTLTTPHYVHQGCKVLLDGISKAHKYLVSGKSWVNFKEQIGFQAMIRSLETLYGGSGWHSHFHVLWFVDAKTSLEDINNYVSQRWESACHKQGLIPKGKLRAFRQHAVKVTQANNSGDYLAKMDDRKHLVKWGADRELAKGNSKSYREKSGLQHPFELAGSWSENADSKSADLFMEYISAFKGKAQIFWTRGLKKRVGIGEVSDQEASEVEANDSEKVLSLDFHSWDFVLKKKMRAQVLDMVELFGPSRVEDWLRSHGLSAVLSHLMPRLNKKTGLIS